MAQTQQQHTILTHSVQCNKMKTYSHILNSSQEPDFQRKTLTSPYKKERKNCLLSVPNLEIQSILSKILSRTRYTASQPDAISALNSQESYIAYETHINKRKFIHQSIRNHPDT